MEDGVGHRGVTQPGMPVLDGQLVGDDGGALATAVVDDLQQVGAGGGVNGAGSPVIKDENVGLGQLLQPAAEAT